MSSNLGVSALEAKIEQYLKAIVPIGTVVAFAGTAIPAGWLLCGGSPVSIAAYPELSAAIGVAHGNGTQNADGSASGFSGTHFNLPDYRGRFLRGVDGGAANDPDRASRTANATGGNTGDAVGSVQGHATMSHTHTQNFWQDGGGGGAPNNPAHGAGATNLQAKTSNATGGNETRPKNANVNYIIRAV